MPDFDAFDRGRQIQDLYFVTLAQYETGVPVVVAYPPKDLSDPVEVTLAQVVSEAGLTQLHVAETEKYAHVTVFINGGREKPWPSEDRVLVPSPKVATYDLAPEMSAAGVAQAVIDRLNTSTPDLIIMNFANCDMVGHSGMIPPTIRAVETVDRELSRVLDAVAHAGGVALVTADHGNAEMMIDPELGTPHTAHTTCPVPFILVPPSPDSPWSAVHLREGGILSDIGPTVLDVMGLPQPSKMLAKSLLEH
jgi:2,3-bisphosphoglycerate-independent phosphoglycerate mutase